MKKRVKTGGSRMVQLGYKPSQVWLSPAAYDLIKAAAEADGRPITKFIIMAAVAKAKEDLKRVR